MDFTEMWYHFYIWCLLKQGYQVVLPDGTLTYFI